MPPELSEKIRSLLSQLTLEEKASLLSGDSLWTTKPIPRLDVPSIWLADGPHGVRKATKSNEIGVGSSVPATNFPSLSALACSWDVDLVRRVGEAIGQEAQAQGVDVVLGPGVNVQRSPLGGRNFEYFSEDPLLAGELATGFVDGLQSQGVGASVKHFAANDQETERMSISAEVDERTLREIHLRPFEIAVTKSQPWTVMSAYNRVNGVFASESAFLLDQVLKQEWGFEGLVVSDWGAVNDRVEGVRAGLHLQMPSSGGTTDRDVVEAVRAGRLEESHLDAIVGELLAVVLRAASARTPNARFDADAHHALAREAAAQSAVLLRNPGDFLPFDSAAPRRIALIGRFAKQPRIQGGGSSQVTPIRVESAFDAFSAGSHAMSYADGTGEQHEADAAALAEATPVAAAADLAVVFVGLPAALENEGVDRTHIDLPPSHDALVDAIAGVQPNLVVVVVAGAPVRMPWIAKTKATLLAGLGGQAGGAAVADVVLGRANPSGKLAVSFPQRLEDTPAFLHFPGEQGAVRYGEGIFVGYRHYDTAGVEPLFAFGHGLSYTRFGYRDLTVSAPQFRDCDGLDVTLRLRNEGTRAGREIVQLYLRDVASRVRRPAKELAAFAKVSLQPSEEQLVRFHLDRRAFAFWDVRAHAWATESGEFELLIGSSSRDIRLRSAVTLEAVDPVRVAFDRHTPIKHWLADEEARAAVEPLLGGLAKAFGVGVPASGTQSPPNPAIAMLMELPIGKLVGFSRGAFSGEALDRVIETANRPRPS